jgi:erythronate-4-phosphate dehydrogenase
MVKNRLNIVADENIPELERYFSALGTIERVNGRQLKREQLLQADILLVRSVTNVDANLLAGTAVKFVATATIGTDHLDTGFMQQAGIAWASAPGCNANSVVDYVMSVLCRMPDTLAGLLNGQAKLGIVGMGNVGSRLYQRLCDLSINCLAYDPLIDQARFPILTDYESVLAADVVCFHAPLTKSGEHPSFHLLSQAQLKQLKPDAVLINAGRGAVVDNQALKQVLQSGQSLSVALDVWENEPDIDTNLMACVDYVSPHIAGYSLDGKVAGTAMIYQACCRHLGLSAQRVSEEEPLLVLNLSNTDRVVDGLCEAVLAVYDVAEDDRLMRETLRAQDSTSEAFDQLRKQYRVRREFSRYCIANSKQCTPELLAALKAAGFVCGE